MVAAGTLQMGIQPSDVHRELKDVINVAGGHLPVWAQSHHHTWWHQYGTFLYGASSCKREWQLFQRQSRLLICTPLQEVCSLSKQANLAAVPCGLVHVGTGCVPTSSLHHWEFSCGSFVSEFKSQKDAISHQLGAILESWAVPAGTRLTGKHAPRFLVAKQANCNEVEMLAVCSLPHWKSSLRDNMLVVFWDRKHSLNQQCGYSCAGRSQRQLHCRHTFAACYPHYQRRLQKPFAGSGAVEEQRWAAQHPALKCASFLSSFSRFYIQSTHQVK